jgi:hypothetical protein
MRTSKARVLQLMREAQLPAPSRMFLKAENLHTRTIITARLNEVSASDHTLTATVEEGHSVLIEQACPFVRCKRGAIPSKLRFTHRRLRNGAQKQFCRN